MTVSGEPGLATDRRALGDGTAHAATDFDFGRWLEDRERIARPLPGARVFLRAYRPDEAPGRRGRRAAWPSITGSRAARRPSCRWRDTAAPTELLEQLRQAWADSALVELLDADLAAVMREHLVERGYLRAGIAVTWTGRGGHGDRDGAGGPPARSPRSGVWPSRATVIWTNEALLAAAQASAAGVAGSVARPGARSSRTWSRPTPARGYLAAVVTAGAVVFSDGVGHACRFTSSRGRRRASRRSP